MNFQKSQISFLILSTDRVEMPETLLLKTVIGFQKYNTPHLSA